MEGWKFWWGIGAFFLGGLATQLNGWLTYRRQRADKLADERAAVAQRREEFELRHLVEVNQLLRDLVVHATRFVAYDRVEEYSPTEDDDDAWGERVITTQAELSVAEAALSAQVGFILDSGVRALVRDAANRVDEMTATFGPTSPYSELAPMGRALSAAYDAISARVRELYAGR